MQLSFCFFVLHRQYHGVKNQFPFFPSIISTTTGFGVFRLTWETISTGHLSSGVPWVTFWSYSSVTSLSYAQSCYTVMTTLPSTVLFLAFRHFWVVVFSLNDMLLFLKCINTFWTVCRKTELNTVQIMDLGFELDTSKLLELPIHKNMW